jgi:hypothetical protein
VGVVFYPKIAENATRSSRSDRNKPVNSTNNNTRGETMKLHKILLMAVVLIVPANVWAYGEGGGSDGAGVCAKVKFSEFMPINNAEVAPKSGFSFYASEYTDPKKIKVTIKGQSIPLTVVEKQNGFKVTGKLPDGLSGTYAKINIEAKGIAQCEVAYGWLVKVTQ